MVRDQFYTMQTCHTTDVSFYILIHYKKVSIQSTQSFALHTNLVENKYFNSYMESGLTYFWSINNTVFSDSADHQ